MTAKSRTKPPYTPSDDTRNLVRSMAAAGLSQTIIQRCLPNAPKSDKTFRKAFRVELETSGDIVTAKAVSKLVSAIDAGQAWAICFWLKCKAGFVETQRRELVGEAGAPIELHVVYADKSVPK
jgi:hypothetical protein